MNLDVTYLMQSVMLAAFTSVGLIETIKSFLKTEKKWIYAVIMIPLSVGCYAAVLYLPPWVIGGLLTVAAAQLSYQTIVQTFQAIAKMFGRRAAGLSDKEGNDEAVGSVQ